MARIAAAASALLAASLAGAAATAPGANAPTKRAYIRVDQLGYAPHAPKTAYLLSTSPEQNTTFAVKDKHGKTVATGKVGSSLGKVNSTFRFVYALTLKNLTEPGTYTITASKAKSPPFQTAKPRTLYAKALANAVYFYENERDGPNFIRTPLRTAPGHLNDAHAQTYLTPKTNNNGYFKGDLKPLPQVIDAAGGWWDAGDYLKFVETTSYAVDMMLTGINEFRSEMGHFGGEARFGLDWLLHMWNDGTRTMYYQVGIGEGNKHTIADHDIWRLPQADDTYGGSNPLYRYIRHRPAFRAGPPGAKISPNLAGRDAAAFAFCFQTFHKQDPSFADQCLLAAEHVYALADTHPKQLTTVIPYGFYPETEWRDDMELGATELATALTHNPLPKGLPQASSTYYLRQAAGWAHAYLQHEHPGDTLNLYDVSGLANYELYRAIARAKNPKLAVTKQVLLAGMRRQLQAAIVQAAKDPFGAGIPWDTYDTGSHLAGLSVEASEYAALTRNSSYRGWSVHWLDNLLGANAWGSSLIIGDGTNFPQCPQHQVANLVGSLNGSPPVLKGALVEGPNSFAATGRVAHMRRCPPSGGDRFKAFDGKAIFRDNVQAYSNVEPAIDLTASSPLAFSWQIASQHP